MPRFDPAHRAAELRALVEQLRTPQGFRDTPDHPMFGKVRFDAGAYKIAHLGVSGSSTLNPEGALRAWADAAIRRATPLEAAAPRLPQPVRS